MYLEFNSSPQGDGNTADRSLRLPVVRIQLIPARGRKPEIDGAEYEVAENSTHPRKGTETNIVDAYETTEPNSCLLYTSRCV